MDQREMQRQMYELGGSSAAQRATLALLAGACVALGWWLVSGAGLRGAHARFAWLGPPGNEFRRLCLGAGLTIYYVRILFTEFVFLKRGVSWNEVLTIVVWLLCIVMLLSIAGGTNKAPLGSAEGLGAVLFVFGSWMNSYAEYARHVWKLKPENKGKLYIGGLFRFTRHPNYLGDLLSFSGLCLMSGAWITVIIPVLMLAGFVFVNIPMLDAHLHDHYGAAFDEYARHTRKLIPFLW